MANVLDFTKMKKEYLTVKLADEEKTVLMIGIPSKKILNEFIEVSNNIGLDDTEDSETLDELYSLCAKIMSFNKGGIKITQDHIESIFDIEDITCFFRAYGDFIKTVTGSKN